MVASRFVRWTQRQEVCICNLAGSMCSVLVQHTFLSPSIFPPRSINGPGELKTATSCRKHLLKVAMATGRSSIKVPCENEDLPDKENAPDFDEDTLRATADFHRNQGNEAFKKGDFIDAIHFYTKGIKVNCNEKELKAKLYNNRAIAHLKLGNHQDSLRDVEAAIELMPTSLKAIMRGAIACVKLKRFKEAITWCDKGLAVSFQIDNNNRILLSLRLQSLREVGDKSVDEKDHISYDHVGPSSGDVKKVIDFYNWEAKHREGNMYCNLGNANINLVQEVGDKHGEGGAYGNLGIANCRLGDLKKAIEFHNLSLKILKEVGDKHGEGKAYGNLGVAYKRLGDFKKAIEYHHLHLKIAKEIGDKHGEGGAYGNLGNAYYSLSDFKKAIEYHNLHLKIAKEVGDKYGEGGAYGNLGSAYYSLGDFKNAIEFHNLNLKVAKEVADKFLEATAYYSLGCVSELLGRLPKAVEHYQASITLFNSLRVLLKSKDEWKVNFRNQYQIAYTGLWRVLVEQGNMDEALLAAEKGRAQALTDLMEFRFCGGTSQHKKGDEDLAVLKDVPLNTVFQAVDGASVSLWVVSEGKQVQLRQCKLNSSVSGNSGASQSFKSFILGVYTQLGVRSNVRCENRSLDALRENRSKVDEKTKEDNSQPSIECLSTLYDTVMKPVADLLQGDELLIIPDGPLWLVPYAALKDGNSKYLCESFRIRLAPSLTSLRLIADCPDDYHKSSGALLVGDPWVAEVTNSKGEILLEQLPCAKEEVEMIGKILNITPITGRQATKREVLKRLSSVSLVHFAAHGWMETGEIALTPDPHRRSTVPTEEDYILTIGDVLNVQLRAKLVVLSCCHSGRGEIKAEGVVGIARAFMGAGARSVVVSLWAIDDEATLELMKCFYQNLAKGKPASESLNLSMKSLRESDKFRDIKYWAPFFLIGDDVTLDFMAKEI
ncbi:tetratricopeptide repeat protein 28-like [Pocillopora verrucosa]|uniref:tetratricopeptide repeat protein 28-like n=1 Tax=Pocillopora verrucosa TaxID=203993 RepID=UPI003340A429